jgi:hypothetical protein
MLVKCLDELGCTADVVPNGSATNSAAIVTVKKKVRIIALRRSAVVRNATGCIEKAKPRGTSISPILELNLFMGVSRFWQGAFPLRQHHLRTCIRRSLCFRKIWFR